jgi:hypothetical protein
VWLVHVIMFEYEQISANEEIYTLRSFGTLQSKSHFN